jgi:hypothetical protein
VEILGPVRPQGDDFAAEQNSPLRELIRKLAEFREHRGEVVAPAACEAYHAVVDAGKAAPATHFGSIAHSSGSTGMPRPPRASMGEIHVGSGLATTASCRVSDPCRTLDVVPAAPARPPPAGASLALRGPRLRLAEGQGGAVLELDLVAKSPPAAARRSVLYPAGRQAPRRRRDLVPRKLTRWMVPVVLGALALSVGSLASASANHGFNKNVRLVFIEKSTAGTFVDVDKSGGQSVGDVFVFQSDLLDPATNAKVGTVEGHCTLITASGDISDCEASGILAGGQIRVGGESSNANTNVLAVTGGTGIYRNVSGQITTETIDDNTNKDTLELTGVRR